MNDLRLEVARALGKKLGKYVWGPAQEAYVRGTGPMVSCFQQCADSEADNFSDDGESWHMIVGNMPDWPNDPGAVARDVLPEIERLGFEIVICNNQHPEKEWCAVILGHKVIVAKTLAEAVCRCFVAAVDSLRKDG